MTEEAKFEQYFIYYDKSQFPILGWPYTVAFSADGREYPYDKVLSVHHTLAGARRAIRRHKDGENKKNNGPTVLERYQGKRIQ